MCEGQNTPPFRILVYCTIVWCEGSRTTVLKSHTVSLVGRIFSIRIYYSDH
jgi:hypothetical protein